MRKRHTSLQKLVSIALNPAELGLSRSDVNVPGNVAVPGKRNIAMVTVVSLSSVLKRYVI